MDALIQYGNAIEAARNEDWEGLRSALNLISPETLKEVENSLSEIRLSETLKKDIIDGLAEVEKILKQSLETKTYLPELDKVLNKIYDIYLSIEEDVTEKGEKITETTRPELEEKVKPIELPEDIDESLVGTDIEEYPDLLFKRKSMNKKAQDLEEEVEENIKKFEETLNELESLLNEK